MTIADVTLFNQLAYSLDQSLGNLQNIQEQLGSGKAVNEPSDNPAAFAAAQLLEQEQSAVTNDQALAQQVQGQLTNIDSTFADLESALNSAIQTATAGSTGSVSASQMSIMAAQAQSLLTQIIGDANAQYGNSYVFGGDQTLTAPYSAAGVYSGDGNANSVTFSNGTQTQLTYDGQAILGDNTTGLINTMTNLVGALSSDNQAAVAAALPALQTALQTVATARSVNGSNLSSVNTLISDAGNRLTTLQASIGDLTDTDVAQAASNEQEVTLQEQALVAVGSDLGKLPLINILA